MPIRVYNTLTKRKEVFEPFDRDLVRMYTCGPTVYNHFHIGNARAFVVFDMVRRYLRYRGYRVRYVQNFTDVDDKLIRRAAEEKTTVLALANRYIEAYFEDADALGIERADVHPRVTEHIPAILEMIGTLIKKGHAYTVGSDVYFDTSTDPAYGKLSGQDLDALLAGARVEVDERKRHPLDFALWKGAKEGEIAWDSPWGKGRPGWHIECSVMSRVYLGDTIDIHAGGQDLIFPHHENEIAQSECATGRPFVRYWLHNGYIQLDDVKMSKSLGNIVTVRELRNRFRPRAIRLYLLSAHYRNPLNFSVEQLEQAERGLERIEACLRDLDDFLGASGAPRSGVPEEGGKSAVEAAGGAGAWEGPGEVVAVHDKWVTAMDDDFNTADALGALFEGIRLANQAVRERDPLLAAAWRDWIGHHAQWMGLVADRAEGEMTDPEIEELIARRAAARRQKDWETADRIREQLLEMGIIVEDTPHGVRWRRKGAQR